MKLHLLNKNPISKRLIKKYLPQNPVIVEAGAHVGRDTVEMAKIWPGGVIHAFEPIPDLFEKLVENTKNFRNVFCYNIALSNENGRSIIHVSSGGSNGSSSLLNPKDHLTFHPEVLFDHEVFITASTLDSWALKHGVLNVDFLWFDLQGMEYHVIKSSPNIFSTIKLFYTEFSLIETYEGVILYDHYKEWLYDQGFIVIKEDLRWNDMGNALLQRFK